MDILVRELCGAARSLLPKAAFPQILNAAEDDAIPGGESLRALIGRDLDEVVELLFRGYAVKTVANFEHMVKEGTPELLAYEFGSTPRSRLQGKVYTSTEYPAHQHIPLHNEQSYTAEWPLKI